MIKRIDEKKKKKKNFLAIYDKCKSTTFKSPIHQDEKHDLTLGIVSMACLSLKIIHWEVSVNFKQYF